MHENEIGTWVEDSAVRLHQDPRKDNGAIRLLKPSLIDNRNDCSSVSLCLCEKPNRWNTASDPGRVRFFAGSQS